MTLPCQQTERIERIENNVDKIAETVAGHASDIRLLNATVQTALKRLDDQEITIKGSNGDPGLVGAVSKLNLYMDDLYKAMRGEADKPGLISVISTLVKKIEGSEEESKWIKRLIIGWVLTTALRALGIIFKP